MRKIISLVLLLISSVIQASPSDTSTVTFNFNNLTAGNLNIQDGWITTKYVDLTHDITVGTAGSYDATNCLKYDQSGPSVGASASRTIDTIFSGIRFSDYGSRYIISYDIKRNYWALKVGVGADLNLDGKIDNSSTNEQALVYTASGVTNDQLMRPNGSLTTLPILSGSWSTVEMTLYNLRATNGRIDVRTKILGTSTWTTLVNAALLGIDTNATDKRKPALWDRLFMHFEGATGYIDNIRITRITNSPLTSVQEQGRNELVLMQNPVKEKIILQSPLPYSKPVDVKIFSSDGRLVHRSTTSQMNKVEIDVADLRPGVYFLVMGTGEAILNKKFVKE